jgi:hypothetical protein
MAQSDENVSVQLIRKYRGTSPEAYWIASDDLIGKFQWVQYFGTGCDARSDSSCPLYMQLGESSRSMDNTHMLEVENLYKGFEGLIAVSGVYLHIDKGEINIT